MVKKGGNRCRRIGAKFELKFRKTFTDKGWIIDKFNSNIDLDEDCIKKAGNKFIPGRGVMPGAGFPDFVMFKKRGKGMDSFGGEDYYDLLFVECKFNNRLTKLEKQKLDWLVKKGHRCFVAYDENGEIKTREFVEYKEASRICGKEARDHPRRMAKRVYQP